MIKNWLCTGDPHGQTARYTLINPELYPPNSTGIIVLGDGGNNYYLDARDIKLKRTLNRFGYAFYFVRGNHEARPEDIDSMALVYDEEVKGLVYYEHEFPNIHYFMDGGEYTIDGKSVLVIGGAYSVDKEYRLLRGWQWFHNEQLDTAERDEIFKKVKGKHYDLVLTHTCPYSWEPRELFLSFIDQSKVDTTTELWLENVKDNISFDFWLFGHFHGEKIVNANAAMLYEAIVDLGAIGPIDKYTEFPEGFNKEVFLI